MGCSRERASLRQDRGGTALTVRFDVVHGAIVRTVQEKVGDVIAFESWSATPGRFTAPAGAA